MRNLILIIALSISIPIVGGVKNGTVLPGTLWIDYSTPYSKLSKIDMVAYAVYQKESLSGLVIETEDSKREGSVGPMQIQKGMVDYINDRCKTHFTYADRLDWGKSLEMFRCFQQLHNPTGDVELAAHIWNAGQNRVKERWHLTEGYRKDVLRYMKEKFNQ